MEDKRMTVGDLFSGCGGFSLGFDYLDQNFKLVYALDNWDVACKSYKANFPYVDVDCRNALEIPPKEIPKVDILLSGPPCQEFTIMKTRKLGKFTPAPRTFGTSLVDWFLSVVEYMKPKFWIMENVPAVKDFVAHKYYKKIYKMSEYGVPQHRKRLFCGLFNKPEKSPCKVFFPTVINEAGGFRYRPPRLGVRLGSVFRRRALIHETKLIQTFPLDFIVCGKLGERYKQIGNAVPPLMSYRFAQAMIKKEERLTSFTD